MFKDLEIRNFLTRFFKINGLFLHTNYIYYTQNTINLKILYYISNRIDYIFKHKLQKPAKNLNTRNRTKRKEKINFPEYLLESLYLYTNKTKTINITLQNLNKGLTINLNTKEIQKFKQIIFNLRNFKKAKFFKEALNIITITLLQNNSAKFLADYIALQLKLTKKHNFFFNFLKKALSLLLKSNFVEKKGIKIKINGCLNGRRRARVRNINIGTVSLQSFRNLLTYHQSTAYTKNGTIGVSIWINDDLS